MANIISGCTENDFTHMLYEAPVDMINDYHDSLFGDGGIAERYSSAFKERVQRSIKRVRSSRAYRATQAAYRKIKYRGRKDVIKLLMTPDELQQAAPIMQEYIMSSPVLRRRWQAKRLAGYEDGYNQKPVQKNAIKHSHSLFRQVMNNTVHTDEDGSKVAHSYAMEREENHLSLADRADLRVTIRRAEEAIWDGDVDITSQYNAKL